MKSLKHLLPENALILSPMAGFSDSPYRQICRNMGSALSITEFVSTDNLIHDKTKAIDMFRYRKSERPVVFQIFGNSEDVILKACEKILPLNPDGIDLNMGCSVKKVALKGSGAGLLLNPTKARSILAAMVKETDIPISAKIRLGWDEKNKNYLEIARAIEQAGAWAIAVHGRTRQQGYKGQADWQPVSEIKKKTSLVVFGNGDVTNKKDSIRYMKDANLDGILIGRGAMGNPWIFNEDNKSSLTVTQRLPIIKQHLESMVDFYGHPFGVVMFRKHLIKYLADVSSFKQAVTLKQQLLTCEEMDEVLNLLKVLSNFHT